MKQYETYQVEDFFQDLYFRKWVLEALPPDDTFWPDWQAAHPGQRAIMEEAKALILAFQCEENPADPMEVQTAIESILSDIRTPRLVFYRTVWFRACASVVLVLGAFLWFRQGLMPDQGALPEVVSTSAAPATTFEKINQSRQTEKLVLDDGSTVWLDTGSVLRVSGDFGKALREVYLEGSAVFDVSKDPHRPFLVHTGELVTKVLGTSFRIRAYTRDADVQVAVKTGKVTVFKNKKTPNNALSEEIILTPNQQAVYLKSNSTLIKTLVPNPMQLHEPVKFRNFEYSEAPIPQVLTDLEEVYGVKILFDEQSMKDCNLTARLGNESLFVKLTMICETIQASYEIIDGQIVISGGGCVAYTKQ